MPRSYFALIYILPLALAHRPAPASTPLSPCAGALVRHIQNADFTLGPAASLSDRLRGTDDLYVVVSRGGGEWEFRDLARESSRALFPGLKSVPGFWVSNALATWSVHVGAAGAWRRLVANAPTAGTAFSLIEASAPLHAEAAAVFGVERTRLYDRDENIRFIRHRLASYLGRSVQTPSDLRDALIKLVEREVPVESRLGLQTRIYRDAEFGAPASMSMFNDVRIQAELRRVLGWIAAALGQAVDRDYAFGDDVRWLKGIVPQASSTGFRE